MVSVVSSPTRVYIKIKTWDMVIITPTSTIVNYPAASCGASKIKT
jgi:hypothetical protein